MEGQQVAVEDIQALARKAAHSGLRLRDARALFEALYIADALHLADGNLTAAARISGVDPAGLHRRQRKAENGTQWGDQDGEG